MGRERALLAVVTVAGLIGVVLSLEFGRNDWRWHLPGLALTGTAWWVWHRRAGRRWPYLIFMVACLGSGTSHVIREVWGLLT